MYFSAAELRECDGMDGRPMCMSVFGKVFEITGPGRDMYQPAPQGQPQGYYQFIGR